MKVAIVTGAGSGIGRASSLALMKAGFSVVLAGRRKDALEETAKLGKDLGKSLAVPSDMTDPASIAALFAKTMEVFGRLDVLFNNAGVGTPPVPLEDISLQQWQTTVATNLTAPFLCTQHAFRIMKDQTPRGGRIINNGSISAYAPRPFSSPYTSTKHAISGLTRATALDGRAYDIACGQIDIGNAATEMTERMTGGVLQPRGDTMVEPRMDVQNVADAIVFMATRSLDANALFLNIMATKMPFVGRGVKGLRAHIVVAHPEPQSYNAHLAATGRTALERNGWSVTVSDLYQMGFDPCERPEHYPAPLDRSRFDVQSEQRHASATQTIPPDVAAEIARLDQADLLILQYPMWWHLPPAILKGWFDRVFIYGDVYTSKKRFENGRFVGKKAMLSVTVGTSKDTYAYNGRSGDIDLLLWPINFSLAYGGFSVLEPFVAYGVEAGLRYSDPAEVEARLKAISDEWATTLSTVDKIPSIPFNQMAHWGSDGRITPDAPVYSPFIRRKPQLPLE